MTDWYVDPTTNDWVIEDGDIKWVPTQEDLCRQQVSIALNTFRGEWFRNIEFGVPWIANENNLISLLTSKDKDLLDSEVRRVTLKQSLVIGMLSYESNLEVDSGKLSIDMEVDSPFGPISISTTL